jgi:hypothetical protein
MMRFAVGQVYASVDGNNHAIVVQIRSDGREGLLRVNGGREEWFLSAEFLLPGKWRLVGPSS